ncbi:MAG: BF3164 family lipoprotein [Prolixibacteraceae bacterium]|jgi:hypothetical protein|nr:BF3164 family lipoprotein [Prolixibacteraceae bacterium]
MRIKYFVILLILSLVGCKKKEVPFIDNFSDKGKVPYSVIENLPNFIMYYPIRMLMIKNMLIVADYKGNKIFTLFNLESGKSFQFGNQGHGPNDFIDGYGLAPLTDTSFVVFDRMVKKVSFFRVENDTVFCYKKSNIPAINNVFPFNDSIFVTNGNYPFDKNFGVVDLSKDTLYSCIDYPSITKDKLSAQAKQRAYYSHIVRKPNSNRFVAFKASHHIIDVMDLTNNELKLIERRIFIHNEWKMSRNIPVPSVRGTLNRFTAMLAGSDNRIFACYKIKDEDNKSQWSILTFDWDGNPQNRYDIPFIPYAFTSTNDSTLYSIALIGKEYKLVKIDMPPKD